MTRITWGDPTDRIYEYGIDRGVLYPMVGEGVPWNGLISMEEAIDGGEVNPYFFDGLKYLDVVSAENFSGTLTAISAPEEFNACEGVRGLAAGLFATQQPRSTFGLCYRTRISSAATPNLGYKIHLVYKCTAAPSARSYVTKSENVDPGQRAWTITTVPPDKGDLLIKPTAHFIIDSTKSDPSALAAIENALYGTAGTSPGLPTPTEINTLLVPSG